MPGPGDILGGKYRLVREIGRGGMGYVMEGEHLPSGRAVAVKVLHAHEPRDRDGEIERFRREAQAVSHIQSPHVVQILDAGSADDTPYFVVELLHGTSLHQLLRRRGRLPTALALAIVGQACRGLVSAHAAGIVHRDIKPANLYLADAGDGTSIVKVLDFGLAKARPDAAAARAWAALTHEGQAVGSPLYMSPEQALGLPTLDHRTDLWSLGTVLYELVAGRAPQADRESLSVLIVSLCSRPARPLQSVAPWAPAAVAEITQRALAIQPNERFRDAAALFEAIRAAAPEGLTVRTDALTGADGGDVSPTSRRLSERVPRSERAPRSADGATLDRDDCTTATTLL